ncbi:hypothetical protein DY000_02058052 [Brassica cretica]|uniref:Peptidase A1 domain-containing protein n=1 Tax=Brassica cretica TaxID=69181 RepID=A0ABQ7AA69_BRACR|nr:hypothetical protein DY000_02058052 [Brassica cretica]
MATTLNRLRSSVSALSHRALFNSTRRDSLPSRIPALRSTTRSFLDFYQFGNKKAIEDERARLNDEMNRGYFADMKEFKEHGGKIADANKTVIPALSAVKFPELAVTLSNGKVLKLPISCSSGEVNEESLAVPKVSLVCLSFRASSQVQIIPHWLFVSFFKWNQENIQLSFFDPGASSSASMVSCSDRRCYSNFQTESGCSPNNLCSYSFKYGDGSGTSGYYISDFMSFDTVITSTLAINSSAPFVFGCSNLQTGDLQRPRRAVDGIFGLGQGRLSVISQLATQGLAPRVFSHCLKGDKSGGGVMVLGQIKRPDTVYTPLVPSQPHYNVNLQSIAVNNQILPIDPSVFTIATGDGTIIDTGTTLAYLPDEAYVPFVQAISSAVSQYGRAVTYESYQCFDITSGAVDVFPEVSLNFAGGASMVLTPRGYLQMFSSSGSSIWCIGFQRMSHRRITILGDLVLKDKVVVYDLVRQRIGWAEYDCSLEVNVSATRGGRSKDVISTGQWRENSSQISYTSDYYYLLQVVFLINILLSWNFRFL